MRTELHVPSDLKFLTIVEEWLLGTLKAELGDVIDWDAHARRFRLVLVEAYSNVVRHAHKDQPNLPVLLRLELKGSEVVIEVWDYGKGYDLSTYLTPNPETLPIGGYGWLILNRLMDKVEYRLQVNGRNCLSLEASLPQDNHSATPEETSETPEDTAEFSENTSEGTADAPEDTSETLEDTPETPELSENLELSEQLEGTLGHPEQSENPDLTSEQNTEATSGHPS